MSYIILDMEWNQPSYPSASLMASLPCHAEGEIIQIGAVRLERDNSISGSFNMDIRPKYFTKINKNVKKLTGFDQQRMMAGKPFPEALEEFKEWCGGGCVFFTWGFDDYRLFCQNTALHGLDASFASQWYNLQVIFNIQAGLDSQQRSLEAAVQHFAISQDLPAHDAYNDAYYTALVASRLDIPRGILEYPSTQRKKDARQNVPELERKLFSGFASKGEVFRSEEVGRLCCPHCGVLIGEGFRWTSQSSSKYFALGRCPDHGSFVFKLRMMPAKGGKISAIRSLLPADEETAASYQKKIDKANERREKLLERRLREKEAASAESAT